MNEQQAECPNYLNAFVTQKVLKVNRESRQITHLITSAAVDRAGDIVEPLGADLTNYVKNPIVLADHNYRFREIVGRASDLEIRQSDIAATTTFLDTDLGRDAFAVAAEGLGGWSIGFRPIEYEAIKDDKGKAKGLRFKRWELLEYSIVAIPMNQDIVNNAITRGLCSRETAPAFFTVQADTQEPSQDAGRGPTADARVPRTVHPALVEIVRRNRKQLETYAVERAIGDVLRKIHG